MIKLKYTTRRTTFGGHYPRILCEIRGGISSGEVLWTGPEFNTLRLLFFGNAHGPFPDP